MGFEILSFVQYFPAKGTRPSVDSKVGSLFYYSNTSVSELNYSKTCSQTLV